MKVKRFVIPAVFGAGVVGLGATPVGATSLYVQRQP